MNAYIKAIMVFNKEGEKRYVPLTRGLNIITGDSQSGKSALLEIIDYCLASSKSTIPKGKITNFGYLYCILIHLGSYHFILGRKSFSENGRTHMYINRISGDLQIEKMSLSDFNDEHQVSLDIAKKEIGSAFGLNVTDVSEDSEKRKESSPTIRNIVSFLFQHQNLIASKFALFYRFDDSNKREQVIKQFPVFSGAVDQEYYNYRLLLDELLKEKKRNERLSVNYNTAVDKLRKGLIDTFNNYYMFLGRKINENVTIHRLLQLRHNLPEFNRKSYLSAEAEQRYDSLKNQLEEQKANKHEIEMAIKNIEFSNGHSASYSKNLETLQKKMNYSHNHTDEYNCPICGKKTEEVRTTIEKIGKSKQWLQSELLSLGDQKEAFSEELRRLNRAKEDINRSIKHTLAELKKIEQIFEQIQLTKDYEKQAIYAKARIDIECEIVDAQMNNLHNYASDDIDIRIAELEEKLNNYNLDSFYADSRAFFNHHISRIVEQLEFEDEFRPAKINFNLHTFDLYHADPNTKSNIYLSEMGSGANWLACHLGLFLTILHYFSVREKSIVPSILFLDQPSQVYFPERSYTAGEEKPDDIKRVENIYTTILKEIELIAKEAGYEPQIIITDHVGELDLNEYNFDDYVRKNWRNEKFI